MKKSVAFLYRWTEISTGKWYEGSRTANGCHPEDGYICSSTIVKPMILENKSNWKREILVVGEAKYIAELEVDRLRRIDAANDPQSFNQHNSGKKFIVTGKIRVNNGVFNKFIDPEKLELFLVSGYVKGMLDTTKSKMKLNHADVSGVNNPMYGKDRSNEIHYTKKEGFVSKIKGMKKPLRSKEHSLAISKSKAGLKLSAEALEKRREKMRSKRDFGCCCEAIAKCSK